jgi:sirohydrochlorin cobaltochelatase
LPSAYLLVTHGSRDLRYQIAIAQLADQVQQHLSVPVGMATLECSPLALHQQIEQFCNHRTDDVQIVPLFLLPGVHVMEDIPEQIAIAQQHVKIPLRLMSHLGVHPRLPELLARRFAQVSSDARILLAHGSRRAGGNRPVETLAARVEAVPAFWSVSPSLDVQIQTLVQQKCQDIAILPYFLFSGGITDAIAQTVSYLAEQYPEVTLQLLSPLEVSDDFVSLIADFITVQNRSDLVMRSS